MSETVKVGQLVPSFEMDVFDPTRTDFGKISLDDLKAKGQWTVLVFYPADSLSAPTELADLAEKHEDLQESRRDGHFRLDGQQVCAPGVAPGRKTAERRTLPHGRGHDRHGFPSLRRVR